MPKSDIKNRFGQRLRKLRETQGLSQEKFAQISGLDRSYVGGIERGERNVSLESLDKLATGLGITLGELMDVEKT